MDLRPYPSDTSVKVATHDTNDGLHLNGEGYAQWMVALREKKFMK